MSHLPAASPVIRLMQPEHRLKTRLAVVAGIDPTTARVMDLHKRLD